MEMGKGFWRLDNLLQRDAYFVTGCNQVIKTTMDRYSQELQGIEDPKDKNYAQATRDISHPAA